MFHAKGPKAHDILRVVHDNRKQVVGLIYTKQLFRRLVVSISHATKLYRVNRPLETSIFIGFGKHICYCF